mmetsp:Transcript_37392/g.105586  ORF Transcript_37392/g.105586 Transcript_37392/m.105586 type:complete len:214 (-) Transcript_37392:21-662(-)
MSPACNATGPSRSTAAQTRPRCGSSGPTRTTRGSDLPALWRLSTWARRALPKSPTASASSSGRHGQSRHSDWRTRGRPRGASSDSLRPTRWGRSGRSGRTTPRTCAWSGTWTSCAWPVRVPAGTGSASPPSGTRRDSWWRRSWARCSSWRGSTGRARCTATRGRRAGPEVAGPASRGRLSRCVSPTRRPTYWSCLVLGLRGALRIPGTAATTE